MFGSLRSSLDLLAACFDTSHHNTAAVSLNASGVQKQDFEEAGLFLNAGLLLFPS